LDGPDIWERAAELVEGLPADFAYDGMHSVEYNKAHAIEMIAKAFREFRAHETSRARAVLEALRVPYADEIRRADEEENTTNWI
jgi:hypothetical protein